MKIKISRDDLREVIKHATSVADPKGPMPQTAQVLLHAEDGFLTVVATDITVSVASRVACEVLAPGSVAVSAEILDKVVSGASADVTLNLVEHALQVKTGKSKFKLATTPAAEFPRVPDHTAVLSFAVDPNELFQAFATAGGAASKLDFQFHMQGVFLDVTPGEIRAVGTDGHRLVTTRIDCGAETSIGVIVPKKGITQIQRVLRVADTCHVGVQDNILFCDVGSHVISSKLIGAEYPAYKPLIESVEASNKSILTIPSGKIIDACRSVEPFVDVVRGTRITFAREQVVLDAACSAAGEAQEIVETPHWHSAAPDQKIEMALNTNYLVEAVGSTPSQESVEFRLNGPLDPVMLKTSKVTALIMPMRVN